MRRATLPPDCPGPDGASHEAPPGLRLFGVRKRL